MVPLANESTLGVEHDSPYHRIRRGTVAAASGELEGAIHPPMI
jgi:hypothetical protein